ncbi:MAG: transposase [Ignavibacteria bacterium CG_4_8_14_3_um_filter_37_9]|nr:transposase [Ignavibacteria bacterium]OIO14014.1 MAG: hypothetical protein AUJ54_15145 [Ignavibacteria bacterium CG1_02_37_35]PIS44048.1 MAG: transposase [Ignavibacteria bacterium CG08_land_8_20_14_0_20_37_9]PIW98674.1 MAG: transposase [Ignavibacteria bacterium CG_4_8_14_3_um_filter_37_9]PJC59366.1 MAG: transposase [Ignavibacteria bacterium CG_4_9_14_0_2_um_filter_37_13]
MSKFINKYRIESARLKDWDYTTPWWYYVTINAKNHNEYFGKIEKNNLYLNNLGNYAKEEWLRTQELRKNVDLDFFVIMPSHIHGIIIITDADNTTSHRGDVPFSGRDVLQNVSTDETKKYFSTISPEGNSLSVIIRGFKASVTKWAHINGYQDFQWQERFFDRIIRTEYELVQIRKYIEQNPLKWDIKKNDV